MVHLFNFNCARDALDDFERKFVGLEADRLNVDKTLEAAEACWALAEWVAPEIEPPMGPSKLGPHKAGLLKRHPELGLVRDLTNARKHRSIVRYEPRVDRAEAHTGDFDPADFSGQDYDVSALVIILGDGERLDVLDVLRGCLGFWRAYFVENGL